ncbi:MAG: non-heme iron oxygenase ferredoxin subunit [Chloroflexi bacterium]|nr:non-heme iron oxygenase ferredoxin subunit [Chloroflexota bacterium]
MTQPQGAAGGYVDVGPIESVPAGSKAAVDFDGEPVGLYNVDGQIFAMDDLCTHDEAYLSEGDFNPSAGTVRCPRHSSHFDVRTGRPRTLPAILPVQVYETKVEQGRILVLFDT